MKLKKLLKIIPTDTWFFVTDQQNIINVSAILTHHTKETNYLLNKKVLKIEPKYDTNNMGVFLFIEVEE